MAMYATFAEILRELSKAEVVPRPQGEAWDDLVARIHEPGQVHEIDEETYYWYLECLPPKHMRGCLFAFAEGAEPIKLFGKRQDGRYVVRQLTWEETRTFCRLAAIPLPS